MRFLQSFSARERAWILYDVGNSAFVLILVTALMPVYFKSVVATDLHAVESTAWWGYMTSASSLVMALLAPFIGALADHGTLKRTLFVVFVIFGVVTTALLGAIPPGFALLSLLIFGLARTGFAGANVLYDAFLVDVTDRKRMDWVSSMGFAWGYVGSLVPFVACLALVMVWPRGDGGALLSQPPMVIVFLVVAAWWLLFSVPFFRTVNPPPLSTAPRLIFDSFARLVRTLRSIRQHKQVFLFLLAYFFYIDAVDSVITMATAYGAEIGLSVTLMIGVIFMIQIVAFPCAILYGLLANRLGTKKALLCGISTYSVIILLAFFLPDFENKTAQLWAFCSIGLLVATAQGGIQALSRSFFGRLIPHDEAGEFFGFYNIFGRFATIMGPALMAFFGSTVGHSRYGVLALLVLLAVGTGLLLLVREPD